MAEPGNILLVDNDSINNYLHEKLIRRYLQINTIETATNGYEALKKLESKIINNNCPDLIFLDLNMPVMDGFAFLEHLKEMENSSQINIRIIVLTSSTHQKDIERIKKFGNVDYMTKPLTQEKLLSLSI